VGIIKVKGSAQPYTEAMNNLWHNVMQKFPDIKDRKITFINVRYDSDFLNFLVYTQAKIYIRADVIEFLE